MSMGSFEREHYYLLFITMTHLKWPHSFFTLVESDGRNKGVRIYLSMDIYLKDRVNKEERVYILPN